MIAIFVIAPSGPGVPCEPGRESLFSHQTLPSTGPRGDDKKWQKIRKLMKDKRIKCKPKKVVVPLPNPNRQHTELQPECVYIKQCSGCCNSAQLECLPVRTKTKTFPVSVQCYSCLALHPPLSPAYELASPFTILLSIINHASSTLDCQQPVT